MWWKIKKKGNGEELVPFCRDDHFAIFRVKSNKISQQQPERQQHTKNIPLPRQLVLLLLLQAHHGRASVRGFDDVPHVSGVCVCLKRAFVMTHSPIRHQIKQLPPSLHRLPRQHECKTRPFFSIFFLPYSRMQMESYNTITSQSKTEERTKDPRRQWPHQTRKFHHFLHP